MAFKAMSKPPARRVVLIAIQRASRKRREVGFIEKDNSDLVLRRGRKSDDYAA
jgi:hypothetical protein